MAILSSLFHDLFFALSYPTATISRLRFETTKTPVYRWHAQSYDGEHLDIGSELAALDNEIEKLVLYKGAGERIEAEDVLLLSPYAAEANIFDLVDAIGGQKSAQAANLLQQKLSDGTDPFYLFAMLIRQFRLLIQVKEVAETGARPPEIAKAIGQNAFVVGKLYQQSHGFSLAQLEQIYAHLLDIDVGVKTGRADIVTSLNLLVAALTS